MGDKFVARGFLSVACHCHFFRLCWPTSSPPSPYTSALGAGDWSVLCPTRHPLPPICTWHNILQDSVGRRSTKQYNQKAGVIVFHTPDILASVKHKGKTSSMWSFYSTVPCRHSVHRRPDCLQRCPNSWLSGLQRWPWVLPQSLPVFTRLLPWEHRPCSLLICMARLT